ncbi:Hypothetical protein PFR_J18_535 [Propionibacterium freudenreichii]|nr:Hypothetical protein PFR_J18_535 [Propionibacterium freudenreichii]
MLDVEDSLRRVATTVDHHYRLFTNEGVARV